MSERNASATVPVELRVGEREFMFSLPEKIAPALIAVLEQLIENGEMLVSTLQTLNTSATLDIVMVVTGQQQSDELKRRKELERALAPFAGDGVLETVPHSTPINSRQSRQPNRDGYMEGSEAIPLE